MRKIILFFLLFTGEVAIFLALGWLFNLILGAPLRMQIAVSSPGLVVGSYQLDWIDYVCSIMAGLVIFSFFVLSIYRILVLLYDFPTKD